MCHQKLFDKKEALEALFNVLLELKTIWMKVKYVPSAVENYQPH